MLHLVLALLLLLAISYMAILVLLYTHQRRLIYLPEKSIRPPEAYGLSGFAELRADTPDHESIQLWYRPAMDGFPTISYFHGNASNLGGRAGLFAALAAKGFGVLAVSYRGYGSSSGSPSETGLYHDARTAIAFLTQQQHIPLSNILLYGESLGTGVAVQMATEFDVAALILQAPYTSVAARAAEIYYYVPVRLLIKDSYNSLAKIARVKAPLLLFHGHLDQTIPIAHAKTLFATAASKKEAVYFSGNAHNDFDSAVISEHVLRFCRIHNLIHA